MHALTRFLACAASAMAAALIGPAALDAAEAPLRIGIVLPTGGFAAEVQIGVDLAVAASNDAKSAGAKRPQVETFQFGETSASTTTIEQLARKKQAAGVVALATETDAADLETAARKAKLPLIVLGAGGPVRTLDPADPVFHVEPSPADRAMALVDLLRLRSARASVGLPRETRKAWVVVEDRAWSRAVAASLHADEGDGILGGDDASVLPGAAPDAAAIAKARGAACDRVVVAGGAATLKAVAAALDAAGWSVPILCTDAAFDGTPPAGPTAKARNVVIACATPSWTEERHLDDVLAKHPPASGAATLLTPTAVRAFVATSALIEAAVAPPSKRGIVGALRDLREGGGAKCAPLFDDTGCVDRWRWTTWVTGETGVAAPAKATFLPDASLGPLLGGHPAARYRVVPGITCIRVGFGGGEGAPPRTIDTDLATLGLNSGDPSAKADTLVREQILARTVSKLGRIYQRSYDGSARAALSYRVCLVTEGADTTGASVVWEATVAGDGPDGKHGGEAFPDKHRCTALGTYLLRNASLLQQAKLVPPLAATDVPYLDGSYAWNTSAEGNQRSDKIRALLDGIGSTFCMKLGKETGHLAGLGIDGSGDPRSVMVTTGGEGVSDEYAYFPPAYVKILEKTLGRVGADGK